MTHAWQALFVVKPHELTVHVITANFIYTDIHNKTNGIFSHTFPAKTPTAPSAISTSGSPATPSGFLADLYAYLSALKAIGLRPPPDWQPQQQEGGWVGFESEWVHRYSSEGCPARLIGSVPGRHQRLTYCAGTPRLACMHCTHGCVYSVRCRSAHGRRASPVGPHAHAGPA